MAELNNGEYVVRLSGKIDSANASSEEERISGLLVGKQITELVFDASDLNYISSAGLRMILRLKKSHDNLKITNVSSEVYEILEMTGFTEMLVVEKAYRVVSVDGCEVIGEGANGKVYRIDGDNVVKTYKYADALSEIQHEREVARLALILGVPTAISYDIVKVGDSYGSVFELLNAKAFSKILANEPDRFQWCVSEYVNMLKKIHGITVPEGKLPSIKEKTLQRILRMKDSIPESFASKLIRLTEDIPETDHMIHGDYHTKNIVLAGNEVLVIDMDTLSVGHPIFDLLHMYNAYVGYSEYDPEIVLNFQGYSAEIAHRFWHDSLAAYLGTQDEAFIQSIADKVRCLSYGYLIDWGNRRLSQDDPALSLWKERLLELLPKIDSLTFETVSEDNKDELDLEATVENLEKVTNYVESRLDEIPCSAKARMQLKLAVEEIFVNIAHYAYSPNTGNATVRVEVSREPVTVTITFIDRGVPYDPLKQKDPDVTLSAEERQIGGLGIFLTKKVMDEISYRYDNGQNILTLKKTL